MVFDTFVEWEKNGEKCMYLVCYFNGRGLKDSNIL
jgi:hypothetical protein